MNNRTHRELLVVDGRTAFVGGAGIADWWAKPTRGKPIWRDMMARIEGPLLADEVTFEEWRRRSTFEKFIGTVARILERQQ